MLSYRHAFHAGNHADVLKHLVEILLIDYLGQKDKPFWYIDTHAGAGVYALEDKFASQNQEYNTGIGRLWDRQDLPEAIQRYVDIVKQTNQDQSGLKLYPGSPWVASLCASSHNKLKLFELHPTDARILQENFADHPRRVNIRQENGFQGIKAMLPPAPRRGLTLIDPPYEDKDDYQHVVACLKDCLKRFATGVYAIWYPALQRVEVQQMLEALKALPAKNWVHARLDVTKPSADGFGMHGSGMFILNSPYTLPKALETVLPWLVNALSNPEQGRYILETGGDI